MNLGHHAAGTAEKRKGPENGPTEAHEQKPDPETSKGPDGDDAGALEKPFRIAHAFHEKSRPAPHQPEGKQNQQQSDGKDNHSIEHQSVRENGFG